MLRYALPLLPRLLASLLLVAALLTVTWQQNVLFAKTVESLPQRGAAVVAAAPAHVRAQTPPAAERKAGSRRPCPRLLHLDATLAEPAGIARTARAAFLAPPRASGEPDEPLARVATPPPRHSA